MKLATLLLAAIIGMTPQAASAECCCKDKKGVQKTAADSHEGSHDGEGKDTKAATPAASPAPADLSAASKDYEAAMEKMHKDMSIPYTNNVDLDFVAGMIPHHQGAIDQAQVLLKHSKNPRLRRLAGGIIASQKREIRFMTYWLEEHKKGVDSGDMPVWLKSAPSTAEEADKASEDGDTNKAGVRN